MTVDCWQPFEASDDAVLLVQHGLVAHANQACHLLLGGSPLGRPLSEYLAEVTSTGTPIQRARVHRSHVWLDVESVDVIVADAPAQLIWLRDLAAAAIDPHEELRSEENYQRLFRNASAAQLLVDPALGTIVDINEAAADLLDQAPNALRGAALAKFAGSDVNTSIKVGAVEPTRGSWQIGARSVEVYLGPTHAGHRNLVFAVIRSAEGADLRALAGMQERSADVEQLAQSVADKLDPIVAQLQHVQAHLSAGATAAASAELAAIATRTEAICEEIDGLRHLKVR